MKYLIAGLLILTLAVTACTPQEPTGNAVKDVETTDTENEANAEPLDFPEDKEYTIDTEMSEMRWAASKIVSNYHEGSVDIQQGQLMRENGKFTSGNFVIDMTSITDADGSQRLESHLKNEDFFDVNNYPTSEFVITQMSKKQGNTYEVIGDLTILDVTNEISFDAQLSRQGDYVVANAAFEIDRTRWGVDYSSGTIYQQLGEKAIKDEIQYELELFFN